MSEAAVLDASLMVRSLVEAEPAPNVEEVHVPGHFDAEVLSGVGRLARAGLVGEAAVGRYLAALAHAPFVRHPVADLLVGAWDLRHNIRLADALYVVLAERLGVPLLTTDAGLAAAYDGAELIG